jgi:hypothetical protein
VTPTVASRPSEPSSLFPSGENDFGVVRWLIDGSSQTPGASDHCSGSRTHKGRPRTRLREANGHVVWHPSVRDGRRHGNNRD